MANRTIITLPDNSAIAIPVVQATVSGGNGGDSTFIRSGSRVASATLSALRVVTTNADGQWIYADSSVVAHATAAIALLDSVISSGASGDGITYGTLLDNSWSWDITLPIFLGGTGTLTQTPPVGAFVRVVAQPNTATSLVFSPQTGTIL